MIFTKFPTESRSIGADAREIATEEAAPAVEAEHLLLALARAELKHVHDVLVDAGLGYDDIRNALESEVEGNLEMVGVRVGELDLRATPGKSRAPGWGQSAKLVLERSLKIADARSDRRITPPYILLGILAATRGTVPRALARAGIDRAELGNRVAAAL